MIMIKITIMITKAIPCQLKVTETTCFKETIFGTEHYEPQQSFYPFDNSPEN